MGESDGVYGGPPPKEILVTGGAGFLGQHLVRAFASLGSDVTVVDLAVESTLPARQIVADVRDYLASCRDRYGLLIHLAAHVRGRMTIEREPIAVARNSAIDAAVFEYAATSRPARMIYMSSSAVYPVRRQTSGELSPLRESEVAVSAGPVELPDLTYGWSKLMGEYLSVILSESTGVPVSVYRPFSVYGPGQSDDYPVSAIVRRAVRRDNPLVVWGSGKQIRDFVYVDDFVSVVLATYQDLDAHRPLNIASGAGTPFEEVARMAANIVGYEPDIVSDDSKPAGVERRVGACRAQVEVHLKTNLADGIRTVIEGVGRLARP